MIARGAIGNPWIFKEAQELMKDGFISTVLDEEIRISTTLRHLGYAVKVKGEKRAVLEHRKFYTGYLKGLPNASQCRIKLMKPVTYNEVEDILMEYLQHLTSFKEAV
jgi:tRNA-dihydrouridine synthase B